MSQESEYTLHWDEKFRSRRWGRYPPEDLVRFAGRTYANVDHSLVSMLEIGCGPGANLWFLHREGYRVAGIDVSSAAIEIAKKRIAEENRGLNPIEPVLKVGDFSKLPWDDQSFELVIDIFAIYANPISVIQSTLNEVFRVLKPGGRFYCKLWGRKTTGFGQGRKIEDGTFDEIPAGPCRDMGVSHFFDEPEIKKVFHRFDLVAVETVTRTDSTTKSFIEEFHCQFQKPLDGVILKRDPL